MTTWVNTRGNYNLYVDYLSDFHSTFGDNNSTMHSIPWNLPIASKSKRGSMTSMTCSSYQGHLHRVTKLRKTNFQVCHALDFFLISTQDLINCLDIMITTFISKSTVYSLKVLINLDFSLFFHILKSLIKKIKIFVLIKRDWMMHTFPWMSSLGMFSKLIIELIWLIHRILICDGSPSQDKKIKIFRIWGRPDAVKSTMISPSRPHQHHQEIKIIA